MLGQEIFLARWMDAQHERHRGLLMTIKGNVVPCPDFQNSLQINQTSFVDPTIVLQRLRSLQSQIADLNAELNTT